MNFLDAIAAALPPVQRPRFLLAGAPLARDGLTPSAPLPVVSTTSVLQFGLTPLALDLKKYADARSNARPDGDLRALVAFRDLVDPLPSFTRYYASSGASTESVYDSIIEGATAAAGTPYAVRLLDEARKQFDANAFANMDGTAGLWRPVYAVPEDWTDLSIAGRFQDLAVDLSSAGSGGAYAMIGDAAPLALTIAGPGTGPAPKALDPATTIHSLRMKYLLVSFRRPWLRSELFHAGGWSLSQQRSGFCSSGELRANAGVFPLLPTGMLLGRELAIDVTWGAADRAQLAAARSQGVQVSLGPFRLNLAAPSNDVQLIAWTSSLVPFSPQQSSPATA